MNNLLLHTLTRAQANDYRLLLEARQALDRANAPAEQVPARPRDLNQVRYLYGEACKRAANLAWSFALSDQDQYRWFLALAKTYQAALSVFLQENNLRADQY